MVDCRKEANTTPEAMGGFNTEPGYPHPHLLAAARCHPVFRYPALHRMPAGCLLSFPLLEADFPSILGQCDQVRQNGRERRSCSPVRL